MRLIRVVVSAYNSGNKRITKGNFSDVVQIYKEGLATNIATSIRLHEKCGFRMVGCRGKIGKKNGVWKDNVLMERRSKNVGNE